LKDIYGEKHKVKTKAPRPINYYIDVDAALPGCPVNPDELLRLLAAEFSGKSFTPVTTPVCLDCKLAGNACLFLDEGFCLGPVTTGGCGAPCPKAGLRCYGCFGPLSGSNLNALKDAAKQLSEKEVESLTALFFSETPEFQDFKIKKQLSKAGVKQGSKREDK
jgi:coenzyme F420-reducing hydrogenase gamma subunit